MFDWCILLSGRKLVKNIDEGLLLNVHFHSSKCFLYFKQTQTEHCTSLLAGSVHDFVYVCLFSYHTVLSDSISGKSSADSVGILAVTKLLWYLMNTALGSVQPVKEEIVLS